MRTHPTDADLPSAAARSAAARLAAATSDRSAPGWVPEQPAAAATPAAPAAPVSQLGAALGDRVPPWLRAAVVAPSGTSLVWLAVAGALVLALVAFLVLRPAGGTGSSDQTAPAPAPVSAMPPTVPVVRIVVDVGGRVRHPGLVTLAQGARVADALTAAGGALRAADLATVNLAAKVTDGELLLIGVPGGATGAGGTGTGGTAGPVDLNAATVEQLDGLPGVGPVLAQRILDWRTSHGGFTSVDQLRQVPGIGPRKFDQLKDLVSA